jgi:hypothetical protein
VSRIIPSTAPPSLGLDGRFNLDSMAVGAETCLT